MTKAQIMCREAMPSKNTFFPAIVMRNLNCVDQAFTFLFVC